MMTNAQLATASLDDIVFDGRNQVYGAYQLRGLYQRHVTRALAIATAIFALLVVFPLVAQLLKDKLPVVAPKRPYETTFIEPPVDTKIIAPPPVAPPPVAPPTQPPAATIRYTPFVAAPDNQVTEEVPEQAALAEARVTAVTSTGSADPDLRELEVAAGPAEVADAMTRAETFTYVEQMPQLPGGGGTAAIVAAIQKAVKYPPKAVANGIEGKLFASFTVNSKGEVTDVKIVQGLGYGLDEETMRAIKTLPRFVPGKQNGREVNVSFTVPITYRIQ